MKTTLQHVTGFFVGLGTAAVGFYLYKKNKAHVDAYLRKHGIELPACSTLDVESLTLEQLVAEKERLEDVIAEREYSSELEPESYEESEEPHEGLEQEDGSDKSKRTRSRKTDH